MCRASAEAHAGVCGRRTPPTAPGLCRHQVFHTGPQPADNTGAVRQCIDEQLVFQAVPNEDKDQAGSQSGSLHLRTIGQSAHRSRQPVPAHPVLGVESGSPLANRIAITRSLAIPNTRSPGVGLISALPVKLPNADDTPTRSSNQSRPFGAQASDSRRKETSMIRRPDQRLCIGRNPAPKRARWGS